MQGLGSLQPQIDTPTTNLDSPANDCLRFTMHFFQPIQQSTQHIYHSALPLSPTSSIFSSMSSPEQTRISHFYGRPGHWGSVVRTIPGDFTCMTTIGRGSTAQIAAACGDRTVRIYDSVTGDLRLSLSPAFPIQEMTGLPDGSILVCTHSGSPLITLWDIQTGGLVQTFTSEWGVESTTVSLNGRYLACKAFVNTVEVWETTNRRQRPDPLGTFEGNTPCWLAPEELIMVVDGTSAYIQNVVTKGPPVHTIHMMTSANGAIYSRIFDRLVIIPTPHLEAPIVIINVKTGASSTLGYSKAPSSVAFSQTAEQLVLSGGGAGLETVDISTGCWTHFDFPVLVASVSTLSNGIVITNVRKYGIQLLRLDQEHASSRQVTPPLATYPLDEGRIIAIVPVTKDPVILLETVTMSQVLSIPNQDTTTTCDVTVLCASLQNKIAVCCFMEAGGEGYLQVWEFSHQHPRWTVPTNKLSPLSSLSPACTRLVTIHNRSSQGFIRVWDVDDGSLMAWQSLDNHLALFPHHITMNSEDQFSCYYDTHRVPYVINTVSQTGNPATYFISRCTKERLDGQVLEERYHLDDGRGWVICGSQRICWIPPGYIGPSDFWAGSSLVMVGQDGTLRKLTFRDSPL